MPTPRLRCIKRSNVLCVGLSLRHVTNQKARHYLSIAFLTCSFSLIGFAQKLQENQANSLYGMEEQTYVSYNNTQTHQNQYTRTVYI